MTSEDFWEDCHKEPPIEHIELACKYKTTYGILSKILQGNSRQNEAIEYCNQMHLTAKKKANKAKVRNTFKRVPGIGLKDATECTHQPKIIKNKTVDWKLSHYNDITIYQRGIRKIHRHNEAICQKNIERRLQNTIDVTFKPIISKNANIKRMFGPDNDIEQHEDDSKKKFMWRYRKTRENEENMRCLFKLKASGGRNSHLKRVNRSLSAKESVLMKQTLHDELISTGAYDD